MSEPFADAEALAREAAAHVHPVPEGLTIPPFAAVVRRAAALSSEQVSVQDIELAQALDALSSEEVEAGYDFGTLDDFLDDVAGFVAEQDVGEPPPLRAELPAAEAAPRAPRWGRWLAAAALLIALPLTIPRLVAWPVEADEEPSGYASNMGRGEHELAEGRASEQPRAARAERTSEAPPGVEPPRPTELEPEPTPQPELEPEPTRAPQGPSRAERIARLDAEAQAAWKRGDLDQAQAKFEALIRVAGHRDVADLAYGDLFAVARQRNDARAELRLWRRYARRFPKGRYIDDARAGICRRAEGDTAAACWRDYLRDRPRGTYRAHAQRVLDQAR